MPRNGAGQYNLPNPAFVAGTKIATAPVNGNFSDLASALTQSFSADGQTPFTGQMKIANGTTASPGYAFTNDTATGMYLAGVGELSLAAGGVQLVTLQSAGVSWNVPVTFGEPLTFGTTTYTFGPGAAVGFWAGLAPNFAIEVSFDGQGSALAGGSFVFVEVPCNCTVKRFTILGDQSGSAGSWVGTNSYASFAGDSGFTAISSGASFPTPTLSFSSATKNQDTTLSGWTTSLTAGELLAIWAGGNSSVSSGATSVQKLTASILCQRTGS